MTYEKLDYNCFYKPVQNFSDLGTGRKSEKILLGDSDDARSSRFSFVASILHNWPSRNEVKFTNGEILNISSQTIRGKRAYAFSWNELTEDLWLQQVERTRLLNCFETAEPLDSIAMGVIVFQQNESDIRICHHPDFAVLNLRQIQIEIMKLSLLQLRKLNSQIGERTRTTPVEPAIVA
jgi:hypothetical protein